MSKTIKDVAIRAGVSTATVSNVVNNTRFVNNELRERVLNAIQDVGYQPNQVARGLRRGDTKSIGLVLPDNSNPFFAEIARYIEDKAFELGYGVFLCNTASNLKREAAYIDMLISKQIDGIIFIASHNDAVHLLKLKNLGIPVVFVDREIPLMLGDMVLVNNEQGGYTATKYLIDLGHKRIACFTGPSDASPSGARVVGYRNALIEAGIEIKNEYILTGDFQFQSGEQLLMKVLSLNEVPTAIFSCNDMMAIGLIRQAQAVNIRIPEDMSVIGFDDILFVSAISPALTTIAQPSHEIAQTTLTLLFDKIQGIHGAPDGKRIVLDTKLVIRDSCQKWDKNPKDLIL